MKTNHVSTALLLVSLVGAAQASPFFVSADGAEVTDSKTGLIWRRCAQGMTLAPVAGVLSCTGTVTTFTHEAALAHARAQAASTGVAWRLPNVKELSSIVDRSRSSPSIDPVAFPATPASTFLSSSPSVESPNLVWAVEFSHGHVARELNGRNVSAALRLVRAGQ
jgi:hypothetical protein